MACRTQPLALTALSLEGSPSVPSHLLSSVVSVQVDGMEVEKAASLLYMDELYLAKWPIVPS